MRIALPRPTIDLQEAAFQQQLKRGVETAKSQIVGVLGRKPFSAVRVGLTQGDLAKSALVKQGYALHALTTTPKPPLAKAMAQEVETWLRQCHGTRCEHAPIDTPPAGTNILFLAVKAVAPTAGTPKSR
jgi:hypothetical protein